MATPPIHALTHSPPPPHSQQPSPSHPPPPPPTPPIPPRLTPRRLAYTKARASMSTTPPSLLPSEISDSEPEAEGDAGQKDVENEQRRLRWDEGDMETESSEWEDGGTEEEDGRKGKGKRKKRGRKRGGSESEGGDESENEEGAKGRRKKRRTRKRKGLDREDWDVIGEEGKERAGAGSGTGGGVGRKKKKQKQGKKMEGLTGEEAGRLVRWVGERVDWDEAAGVVFGKVDGRTGTWLKAHWVEDLGACVQKLYTD